MLGLAAVVALAPSVIAQEGADGEAAGAPTLSAPISVLVAEQLGNDPEAIYRFVADHVRYEPYSGWLRGDAATYFNRAGNSVDQSLLLARLLDAIDVETRFAVGPIDGATGERLLAAAALDAAGLARHRTMAWSGQLPGFSDAPAVPSVADFLPAYDGATQSEPLKRWTHGQVTGTLALLEAALGEAGLELPTTFSAVPADELELHTWVQASIDGEWVDLDPTLPGLASGEALAASATTMDAIPEERAHRVELSVVAETLQDGLLVEEELLDVSATSSELADEPVVIVHVGPEADPALSQAFEAVLGIRGYHPVIVVGDASYGGDDIRLPDPGAGDGGLGGGFFDGAASLAETTAEWVDLTITSPGRAPVTTRRVLFDRVPEALRDAGVVTAADLAPISLVDTGDGTLVPAPVLSVAWIAVATGQPSPLAGVIDISDDDDRRLTIVPWMKHMVDHLAGTDADLGLGVSTFVDAPNVTALTSDIHIGPDGVPVGGSAIDIWHRSRGVLPVLGQDPAGPPAAIPGILAHVSERLVDGVPFEAIEPHGAVSVAAVFETAAEEGIRIRAVSSAEEVAQLPYPRAALTTLEQSIAAGWAAVVPERPVGIDGVERVGWWLVDPVSGRVADQMDDGRGVEVLGYELSNLEAGALLVAAGAFGVVIARGLLSLYYDPPTMSPPGEGFRAIQAFFGWGAGGG